ncbi:MAG TPA: response regulator transcription factor [Erysipelothrix sp.]|nr:response regulator transcription factor [Erysipelothrix sp.]
MKKLIIVDDEYMILEGIKQILDWKDLGIEIVGTFSNGQKALAYMLENPVDIVITDVTMPVMNGIEFIQSALDHDLDFHFIIISGYQDFEYVLEGLRLGAENYLLKPIDGDELEYNVNLVLEKMHRREVLLRSQDALIKDTLYRWVYNDIEKEELIKNLHEDLNKDHDNFYTVAILMKKDDHNFNIDEFLENYHQNLYFIDELGYYTLIINHQKKNHVEFIKCLIKHSNHEFVLGMGETTNELMSVHLSYEHAKSTIELLEFYDNDNRQSVYQKFDTTISLKDYANALGQRDINTIIDEIDKVFEMLKAQSSNPIYARQITFMMYTDLRRAFNSSDEQSEKIINEILNATKKEQLITILKNAINDIRSDVGEKLYNNNIQKMIQIVERDYDQELNLKFVSDELHLNTVYLGQLIKRETGKTFSQYLNAYRIKKAQKLLLTTDLSINEITFAVGYSSSGYFYKNFKRICGVSPTEFKEAFALNYEPIK